MTFLDAAVIVLAGVIAGLRWMSGRARRVERHRRAQFQDLLDVSARELGIVFDRTMLRTGRADGRLDDFAISVDLSTRQVTRVGGDDETVESPEMTLTVSVDSPRIPAGISFSAESGRGEDMLTGDSVFDDLVEVYGPPGVVRGLLNRDLRQKVAVFVRWDGWLEGGRLTLRCPVETDWETPARLRMIVALARELVASERGGVCERLAENVRLDHLPGVRLWNLLQLQEDFAETPNAKEASRLALSDSGPWVRLAAARFLRDEGLPVLEALARTRGVPDQAAAEAIGLLAVRAPRERSGPLLIEILKSHTGDARRQAIEDLGRMRHAPAVGPLIVLLDRAEPRTAAAAAQSLGQLGAGKAEASLLRAAASEVHELRLAAATALGRVGSIRAIEPLTESLAKRRLDAESRQAFTQAIARIQSRLAGAGAGQLSLATGLPETGRLSLATPGAGPGDVSLVPASKNVNR